VPAAPAGRAPVPEGVGRAAEAAAAAVVRGLAELGRGVGVGLAGLGLAAGERGAGAFALWAGVSGGSALVGGTELGI